MGNENDQTEQVSNNKLLEAIQNLQRQLVDNTNKLDNNTKKISEIANSLDEIKLHQDDLKKEFLSFKSNTQCSIRALEASQHKLTESQDFINSEFEDCKAKQEKTEERAKTAEAKIVGINAELQALKETITQEQHRINDLEQYGRRSMLEISNIPVKNEENIKDIVTALASKMKVKDFNYDTDVDVAHRLNSKLKPPPIIVMFRSRTKRDEFYEQRKSLRNITLQDLEIGFQQRKIIFINESLTISNAILFRKARDICKKNKFKFYWTSKGKILCKKAMDTPTILIKDEKDLDNIK